MTLFYIGATSGLMSVGCFGMALRAIYKRESPIPWMILVVAFWLLWGATMLVSMFGN